MIDIRKRVMTEAGQLLYKKGQISYSMGCSAKKIVENDIKEQGAKQAAQQMRSGITASLHFSLVIRYWLITK